MIPPLLADSLRELLSYYGLEIKPVREGNPIPASFWGDEEAGLIGATLFARNDTPAHSILHESCHYICLDGTRRTGIDTDAGGCPIEENAVCYLQILLSDLIKGYGKTQMFRDMDNWGYSFRLGNAKAWFEQDAEDARDFLIQHRLISTHNVVCIGQLRV